MPIYDFRCEKCRHEFDYLLKIEESHEKLLCPKCGSKRLKKLVSSFRTNDWSNFLDKIEKKVSPQKFK
jgi:putative FmdB family regulatory protein